VSVEKIEEFGGGVASDSKNNTLGLTEAKHAKMALISHQIYI
jgi:hypothetical protein